ncbi:unnamed protein product [Peniophora sp. CBMAI 1063]|nr:unnamed protein product [Peniophora sp. CBMAI 1063]
MEQPSVLVAPSRQQRAHGGHDSDIRVSPMTRLLPLDIIYDLIPLLGLSDLLTFMSTCKAFRERGAKHLVSRSFPVRDVDSFELFMASFGDRMYQHIEHFNYLPRSDEVVTAERLSSILSQATRLESLELQFYPEPRGLANERNGLHGVLSSVPSLRRLHLWLTGTEFLSPTERAILQNLNSGLRTLRLSFIRHCDPLQSLPGALLDGLKHLHFQRAVFDSLENPLVKLESLTIEDATMHTRTLITSFPGIQYLRLPRTDSEDTERRRRGSFESELDIMHRLNSRTQELGSSWPSLRYLSGSLTSLYRHAVTAPTQTLHIDTAIVNPLDMELLRVVLKDTRPTCLSITLSYRYVSSMFEPLMSVQSHLKRLDLRVLWCPPETHKDEKRAARELVVSVYGMLARLSLTAVRLDIVKEIERSQSEDKALDTYAIALRLVQRVPTLRDVLVRYQTSEMESTRMRYWSIAEPGDHETMSEMESSVGDEIFGADLPGAGWGA